LAEYIFILKTDDDDLIKTEGTRYLSIEIQLRVIGDPGKAFRCLLQLKMEDVESEGKGHQHQDEDIHPGESHYQVSELPHEPPSEQKKGDRSIFSTSFRVLAKE